MATQNQINANRLNAQKSTGPTTEAGKAVSRLNALKSGIDAVSECLYQEDREAYRALIAEYDREYQPLGLEERHWVDMLIHDEWMLRRYRWLHHQLVSYTSQVNGSKKHGAEHGGGFADNVDAFNRLHRHQHDTDRAYSRHLAELKQCQAGRRQHEVEVYMPVTDSPQTPNPEIGFVSQPASEPAPPAPEIAGPAAPLVPTEAPASASGQRSDAPTQAKPHLRAKNIVESKMEPPIHAGKRR